MSSLCCSLSSAAVDCISQLQRTVSTSYSAGRGSESFVCGKTTYGKNTDTLDISPSRAAGDIFVPPDMAL